MASTGKSVFLIGPGFIGREILDRLLEEGYSITTLVRRESAAKEFNEIGVKTKLGSLDDHDVLADQASLSDIVIYTATADHLPSVQAVLDGIEKRAAEDKKTVYIHNSGTGVLDDNSKCEYKSDRIYEDDKPEGIDSLADDAPHRPIDLAIIRTRKKLGDKAKIVIVSPPSIYGYNPKYGRHSIQMPTLIRFALAQGYAGYVGKGASIWNQIHIFDLARAYLVILHHLERTSADEILQNPYFFCENGEEFSWKEAAAETGKMLYAEKRLESPEPKSIPEEQFNLLFGEGTYVAIGNNARCRANRLRSLGWEPQEKNVFETLAKDEVPVLLQEKGEFKGCGRAVK